MRLAAFISLLVICLCGPVGALMLTAAFAKPAKPIEEATEVVALTAAGCWLLVLGAMFTTTVAAPFYRGFPCVTDCIAITEKGFGTVQMPAGLVIGRRAVGFAAAAGFFMTVVSAKFSREDNAAESTPPPTP